MTDRRHGHGDDTEQTDGSPSRSQRRREATAVFDLAKTLVEMPPARLEPLPIPDSVLRAIAKARRIKSHVARKREVQYVAKLMRDIDTTAIADRLYDNGAAQREETARQHRCEAWRDALLDEADGSVSMTKLCDVRHDLDVGHLRQLVRTALKERRHEKPPTAARQLFRTLREIDLAEALPPL